MTIISVNKIRLDIQAAMFCVLALPVWPAVLQAQEISYDGNRWFEVEISVFSNEYPTSEYSERPVAKNLSLQYLPKLQELLTPISSLMIDFPEPVLATAILEPVSESAEPQPETPIEIGPLNSPAVPSGFKVSDYARDAYIALADRVASFNAINRNLTSSADHRILWHQVWRQPLRARAQTPAILVSGGELVGNHAELEGSLRLSDVNGKPMFDINVWLNRFGNSAATGESEWKVPERPLQLQEAEEVQEAGEAVLITADIKPIVEIWQMQQSSDLGARELYYLDHPALGVVIQLRPYLLPEQLIVTDEGDF